MIRKVYLLFSCFALVQSSALSQENENRRHVALSASIGVVNLFEGTYSFNFRYLSSQYAPGLSASLGDCYGDFIVASPTLLRLSVEFKYTRMSTEDPNSANHYSQMRASQYAGIAYAIVKVPSGIAPSIRFGLGVAHFKYEEEYLDVKDGISTDYWSLLLAMGATLDIELTSGTTISPYADLTYGPKSQQVESNSGIYKGTIGNFLLPSYGVRCEARLW